MVYKSGESPLEKTSFPLMNGYQSEVASGLEMRACVHVPLSTGTPSSPDQSSHCECCYTLCEFMFVLLVLLCVEGFVSLESLIHSDSHNLSSTMSSSSFSFSTGALKGEI